MTFLFNIEIKNKCVYKYINVYVCGSVYTHDGLVLMTIGLLRAPSPFVVNAATVTEYSVFGHKSVKITS